MIKACHIFFIWDIELKKFYRWINRQEELERRKNKWMKK